MLRMLPDASVGRRAGVPVLPGERSGSSILLKMSAPSPGVSESRAVRLAGTPLAEIPSRWYTASRQEATSDIIFDYVVTA